VPTAVGVCILAKYNKINVVSVPLLPCYSHLEICIVDILSSDITSRLLVCYRPPSGNTESAAVQYTRDLCNCISLFSSNGSAIICGDFNLANIDWEADNGVNCTQSTCSGVLLDFYYATGVH
jgi:hypothetical protein